ncbi:MAG TPA: tetratricopeptide repeat protein [Bacteroidetes bacterium]|nr:tetratricopeptide repeat protein [Bacteroidota bacterium]
MNTPQEINQRYRKINKLVARQRLKKALEELKGILLDSQLGELITTLENLNITYESMLKYTMEGIDDPERMKIYNHLRRSILQLNNRAREKILEKDTTRQTSVLKHDFRMRQRLSGNEYVNTLDDLYFAHDIRELLQKDYGLNSPLPSEYRKHHETIRNIFNYLWLTDEYTEATHELVNITLDHRKFPWHERALFVSAITLSLLRYFDQTKFILLHRYFLDSEPEVRERSLTGMILAFYQFDDILPVYPELEEILAGLGEQHNIEKDIEAITLQIIRSKETEQITKKLKEEIIPEITKLGPNLQEKLKLDELIPEDFLEDKNPDWSKVFKGSESLYEKMEEFSKLQMEGADVFMSAFAHLKNFSFFEELMNWFKPFFPDNPVIDESLAGEEHEFDKNTFVEGLFQTPFICNSDKYSFCMNLRIMPAAQKQIIVNLFNAELEGMKEMTQEDSMLKPDQKTKVIYTQYIQDLYRFFKLYPFRHEFDDLFSRPLDLYNSRFFEKLVHGSTVKETIGAYFFEHDRYEEALDIFRQLQNEQNPPSYELTEKMGYACQKLRRFEDALEYYKQAELFDKNKKWLIKKIAYCYRALKKPEEALKYYRQAEKNDPENMYIQASIGHCYLDMEKFNQALKHYFKVEYHQPDSVKIWRPIAWCYFALGKLDEARKYYGKILEKEPTRHDYLNAGHVEWALNNRTEAIRLYEASIRRGFVSFRNFLTSFEADKPWLLKNGIDPDEIPLLLDYLDYRTGKKG